MADSTGSVFLGEEEGTKVLWLMQWRTKPDLPWNSNGTHRADLAATLRIYDWWASEHPDDERRLLKTTVTTSEADADALRELVEAADESS